jgi:hypothetical protein
MRKLSISIFFLLFFFLFSSAVLAQVDPACEDLFAVSCLGANGKSKFADQLQKNQDEALKIVREAREKAAKDMGYKDVDDAFRKRMAEKGFQLIEPVDAEAWKSLKLELNSAGALNRSTENAEKLFAPVAQCKNEAEELSKAGSETDRPNLRARHENLQKKYKEDSIPMLAKDLPNFIEMQVGARCAFMKTHATTALPELNAEVVEACGRFPELRRQAVMLYRMEGSPDYQQHAEKFIRDNMLPPVVEKNPQDSSNSSEADRSKAEMQVLAGKSKEACGLYRNLVHSAATATADELMAELNTSKSAVDHLISNFYSEEKRKQADQIFVSVKSDVQEIVGQFVKPAKQRNEILTGYDNLNLRWMQSPPEADYKKGSKGNLVLDAEKNPLKYVKGNFIDPFSQLADPRLSYFTSLNAFYYNPKSLGEISQREQVDMLPMNLLSLRSNPNAYAAILAHEAGHKIGPKVSSVNGYDLSANYSELLACYKDSKSIKLQPGQQDETIADYISSEVMAKQLQRMPMARRKQVLQESMATYCLFDATGEHAHSINCKGVHPENSLRVSGIFGANPNLRKVIGCEGESSKFKSCGMKQVVLNDSTSPSSLGSSRGAKSKSGSPSGNSNSDSVQGAK